VGVVGNGTRARSEAEQLAISLASAVRLSARNRRIPYTVLMLGLLAVWLSLKSLGETRQPSSI